MRTIGSPGSGPGQLLNPSALAIDGGGTISVADSGNQRIARFGTRRQLPGRDDRRRRRPRHRGDARRRRTYLVRPPATGSRSTTRPAARSTSSAASGSKLGKLDAPGQIALDAAGNLWVADRGNNRIQEFGPDGERLRSVRACAASALGQFVHPSGVSLDCNGVLTVTDSDNNRVQQFALDRAGGHDVRRAAAGRQPAGAEAADPAGAPRPAADPARPAHAPGVVSTRTLPLRLGCDTTCTITADRDADPRRGAAEEAPRA